MSSTYYNMTDSTGASGFLPTVVFTSPDNTFTAAQRTTQLAALGITGFYEADFADNIAIIDASAFSGDGKLVAVSINKVTTIRQYAFNNCTVLRSIILDCGVDVNGKYLLTTIIGPYTFGQCNALLNLYIPDTVKDIPIQMCHGCQNLEVVVMGHGCDRTDTSYNRSGTISGYAFADCRKLSYFVVPETVSSIADDTFWQCFSLASVTILGRPTIGSRAFYNAARDITTTTFYYDNSASYTDLTAVTSTSPFPTNAIKRPYREIDLSAGGAATLTSTHVNSAIGDYNSYWKGKILGSVTSLADNCFRGQTAGTDGIGTTNYSNMIGLSFPKDLTSIGYAAFCNSDGVNANPPACNVGGFYIPNSVSTFGVSGVSGDTFWFTNLSGQNLATTKQFVFQSGRTSPITTLPARMFQYTSAIAMVIPSFTNIGASCFQFARYIQYFNFFQKNAYNTLTKIDGATTDSATNAFSNCFNALTSRTHYLYIPKAVATISTSAFLSSTNPLFITVYSSTTDGSTGTGLCATTNFLTSTYFSGTVAPTFYLINNYYDANGLILGTFVPTTGTYHVLFYPSITTIPNLFTGSTTLKSIVIPNNVTDISASAFSGCTGLTNVLFSTLTGSLVNIGNSAFNGCTALTNIYMNRAKSIGTNAFRNAPLSNTFDLVGATSLEAIYSGAFYTDNGNISYLKQITIPISVKVLGSRAFGSSTVGRKPFFTTLSVGSGIAFWGDYDNTLSTASTTASYEVLDTNSLKYMAIPANFCENCDFLTSVSFLDTVNANEPAAITTPPDIAAPLTRLNKQTLIPDIKRIGTSAFANNQRLQSIRIPDGVTSVDASGFFNAHSLSSLYLHDSLTTIGLDAFKNFGSSNKFYAGNPVSIRIPQSRIGDVSNNFFDASGGAKYFTVSFDNTYSQVTNGVLQRFTSRPVENTIFYNVILQSSITGILNSSTANAGSFNGYTTLKSVNIPDNITDIGEYTFNGCTGLVNVFLAPTSNLTTVGDNAFNGLVLLNSFFFPNSLRGISKSMFSGCTSLASVTYGNNPSIKYIDASGFATNKLTSIYIPSSVVSIGSQAFINSTTQNNLASVTFGAGSRLKSIGGGCFGHATHAYAARFLKDIVLPNSVRCIGTGLSGGILSNATNSHVFRNAFTRARSTNLVLPSSLESLSNWFLFTDSSNVEIDNVYLPKSITNVAGPRKHCGYTTSGLGGNEFSSVTIGSRAGSLLYLPSELAGYTPSSFPGLNRTRSYYKTVSYTDNPLLTLSLSGSVANTTDAINTTQIHADIKEGVVVIGGGTTSIDMSGSVDGSRNLISVNIPSTVTDICANAFSGCTALAYVTFSENSHLTTIGDSAFSDCSMIQDIKLPDTVTTIGPNSFRGCTNLATISIPYNVRSIGSGAFTKPLTLDSYFGFLALGLTGNSSQEIGSFIALSSDGNTLAMSWYNPYLNPSYRTAVVYRQFNSFSWIKLGSNLDGSTIFSNPSHVSSLSLSSDGNTVAIGYTSDRNLISGKGWVQVYNYSNSTWNIVGNVTDLSGVNNSKFGTSVSLSSDGTTVAVGASAINQVEVFKYNISTWNRVGNATDLSGPSGSEFGTSVSLTPDGTTLAVGALYNNQVAVFKYNNSKWNRVGNATDLSGLTNTGFGRPVSLSSDGTTVAVGHNYTQVNRVEVFKYNNSKWNRVGNATDLSGPANFGKSLSLSPDGTTLVTGGQGYVQIWKYTSSWAQINYFTTPSVPANTVDQRTGAFGGSVVLSSDGTTVASGAGLYNYGGAYIFKNELSSLKSVQIHERLYNDISGSLGTYISGKYALQVIPELRLTNTLNPTKLTISQINNMYIRYRQSQLGFCTKVTVSASSGGILSASDVTTALSGITGWIHLDISTNVTSIGEYACFDNKQIYSVAISNTVVTIGEYAFYNCANFTYLSFHPDSVCTTVGQLAFSGSTASLGNKIFDLVLPDSLTQIVFGAFQYSNNLTSVCIPNKVTSLGISAFNGFQKLTSVALPASLTARATGNYFSTSASSTDGITFTTYSNNAAIPHFKLTDYSMPNGIVQNVVDSAVTYIDHLAYAYYPDITLYAVTTNKQTQTAGNFNYVMNGIKMPFQPAAFLLNGSSVTSNAMFPIYRSVPDLNVFSLSNPGTTTAYWADNTDDFYLLMPGYSICIYNNLYDEENLFADTPTFRYYDNEFGKEPLNINVTGVSNTTSSILIMYKGRILSKYFTT
jgi:hypothetical protein